MKIHHLKPEKNNQDFSILFIHGAMHGAWCWQKFFMPFFQNKNINTYAIDLSNHCDN